MVSHDEAPVGSRLRTLHWSTVQVGAVLKSRNSGSLSFDEGRGRKNSGMRCRPHLYDVLVVVPYDLFILVRTPVAVLLSFNDHKIGCYPYSGPGWATRRRKLSTAPVITVTASSEAYRKGCPGA
jgi:hypothetical protein